MGDFYHGELKGPLPARFFKSAFDKLVGLVMLIISAPILFVLKIAYLIEGWCIPENAGPMFFYYWGVSAGKQIPKYKIRLIKKNTSNLKVLRGTIGLPFLPNGLQIADRTSASSSKSTI